MSTKFKTADEAASMGFERAGRRLLHRQDIGGFLLEIRSVDTSGPSSYGYSYGIEASLEELSPRNRYETSNILAASSTLRLSEERNAGGKTGAYCQRFGPGVIAGAKEEAVAWAMEMVAAISPKSNT